MLCPHCGESISELAEVCPKCGVRIKEAPKNVEDKPNIAANIISFCCFPLVGIILFFVWQDRKPRAAKFVLISALASIFLWIVFYVLAIVVGVFTEGR